MKAMKTNVEIRETFLPQAEAEREDEEKEEEEKKGRQKAQGAVLTID